MPAGLTFLNIILFMYLSRGGYGKEEQKQHVQSENKREFMVDNFYINTSHISVYINIYITNYIQTSTLSNYSTIQMNGYRSHCIKIKNGMNRRLRLFILKSANCAEPQVPTKPSEDSV